MLPVNQLYDLCITFVYLCHMMLFPVLIEIVKLAVAGILVLFAAIYILKPYLKNNERLKLMELKKTQSAQTLPLRLQAYERLVLLTDRINPASMLLRLNGNQMLAADLHTLMIAEVRSEYQHNVTQQIYVSAAAWHIVKGIKNDTLALINNVARSLPADATGLDLGRAMLAHLTQLETDPYDAAAGLIRTEVTDLF